MDSVALTCNKQTFCSPSTKSGTNPGVNRCCNAVDRHWEDVRRAWHVNLLHKTVILHDPAELLDHDIRWFVDLPKEVVDFKLLQLAQQFLDPQPTWILVIVRGVRVTSTIVESKKRFFDIRISKALFPSLFLICDMRTISLYISLRQKTYLFHLG